NHYDIDMSHVFISQYKGIKKIWLFPLDQSANLYKLPYNFHSIANLKDPDYEKFPALQNITGLEAEIKPGETLFMPSGYWHFIQYVTEGFSISVRALPTKPIDRKSTRLNSSHVKISYAVFCLKKKNKTTVHTPIAS